MEKQKVTFFDDTNFELSTSTYNDGVTSSQGQLSPAGIYFTPAESNPENTYTQHHIAHNGHIYTLGPSIASNKDGVINCSYSGEPVIGVPSSLNTLTTNNNIFVLTKVISDRYDKKITYTLQQLDLSGIINTINSLSTNIVSLQEQINNISGNVSSLTSFTLTLSKKDNSGKLIKTNKYVLGETAYIGYANPIPETATIGNFVYISSNASAYFVGDNNTQKAYISFNSLLNNGSVSAKLTTGSNLLNTCASSTSGIYVANIPISLTFNGSYSIQQKQYTVNNLSLTNNISVLGTEKNNIESYINTDEIINIYYDIDDIKTNNTPIDSSSISGSKVSTIVYNGNNSYTYIPLNVDLHLVKYKLTLTYNSSNAYININNETESLNSTTLQSLVKDSSQWTGDKNIINNINNEDYTATFDNNIAIEDNITEIISKTKTKNHEININVTLSKDDEPVDRNIYKNGNEGVLYNELFENSYTKVFLPSDSSFVVGNPVDPSYMITVPTGQDALFFYVPIIAYTNSIDQKYQMYITSTQHTTYTNVYYMTGVSGMFLYIKSLK